MLSDQIKHLNPCGEAVKWLDSLSVGSTLQDAWDKCHNGSWMLWLWGKSIKSKPWSDDRKPLLACALDCAETVKHLFGEKTKSGIVVLRQWINGEVNQEVFDTDGEAIPYIQSKIDDNADGDVISFRMQFFTTLKEYLIKLHKGKK